MGIKKGTKLTDAPKCIMYQIRVTSDINEKMKHICNVCNVSKSEFLRQSIEKEYWRLKNEKKKIF